MNLTQWLPTVVVVSGIVGMAYVAQATLKRHEETLGDLVDKVQELRTDVAVLKATTKGGDGA